MKILRVEEVSGNSETLLYLNECPNSPWSPPIQISIADENQLDSQILIWRKLEPHFNALEQNTFILENNIQSSFVISHQYDTKMKSAVVGHSGNYIVDLKRIQSLGLLQICKETGRQV